MGSYLWFAWKIRKTISPTLIRTKWDRFAIWLACDILVLIFLSLILWLMSPIFENLSTPLVNIFSNYISSSVGLETIDLTCTSNDDKKSVKIPEEATLYCQSKKDAANKVKIIFYIPCHILIIIPSLNISLLTLLTY